LSWAVVDAEDRPTIRCSGRAEKARIVQEEEHNARRFSTPLIWALGRLD
jgi:hypothetical protein